MEVNTHIYKRVYIFVSNIAGTLLQVRCCRYVVAGTLLQVGCCRYVIAGRLLQVGYCRCGGRVGSGRGGGAIGMQ